MKIFAAILGIFFLCLATLPCADAAPVENQSIELSQDHDHEHEGQADNCTPFCHCHCCHVHVTIVANNKPLANIATLNEQVSQYRSFAVNDISISLLRPPIV